MVVGVRRGRVYDPELAAMQVLLPRLDITDVVAARATEQELIREMHARSPRRDVQVDDVLWPGPAGEVPVRLYRPRVRGPLPALLFLHGGSFVTGGLHSEDTRCAAYAEAAGCLVVSVDYRLAPEHPFPAGFHDGVAALDELVRQAPELGVDPGRVAVGGLSAGGALAAGLAQHARDHDGPGLVLQLLLFPVLAAAAETGSMARFDDSPVLDAGTVRVMWRHYLGADPAGGVPRYAAPGAEADLAGLPPVYLCVAEFDPLRDEALDYGRRLLDAGVGVDLRHYARAFHAFDGFTATRLAQAAAEDQVAALRAAFA